MTVSTQELTKVEWVRWAEEELGEAGLGDARLDARLVAIAATFMGAPEGSIPRSSGKWSAAKAAYRFFSNKKVDPETIYSRHRASVIERCKEEKVVLAVGDTTYLDYTSHLETDGIGPLGDLIHNGLVMQPTLAVTPERVALGLIHQNVWVRDKEEFGKSTAPEAKKRRIKEKESFKWMESLEAANRLKEALGPGEPKVISVFDREGDVFEVLLEATKPTTSCGLLVRASWDRRVEHPQRYLWSSLEAEPVAGTLQVTVPRGPGQKERVATLSIRYLRTTLLPPRNRTIEDRRPVEVFAVYVLEEDPPEFCEAISWMLLTTEPVSCFDDACRILQWYTCRWIIELFFRVLKSGCRAEERQLERAERLIRCLALDCVVAWRILYLTILGRELPDAPCTIVFEEHEWKGVWAFVHQSTKVPAEPPTLREMVRMVGRLGGHLGRKSDKEPGSMTLWRGLQRIPDIAGMWTILHGDSG